MVVDSLLLGGGVGDDLDGHGGGEGEQEEKELRKSLKFTFANIILEEPPRKKRNCEWRNIDKINYH